jgi:hypothetical protein
VAYRPDRMAYEIAQIALKKAAGVALTPVEERVWAYRKVSCCGGAGMQVGVRRLQRPEDRE